jgi:hypothetical protein
MYRQREVRRDVLETKLTEKIRRELLRPEVVDEFRARLARALRRPNPIRGRRRQLEHEFERLVDAIAKGLRRLPYPHACRPPRRNWRRLRCATSQSTR